MPWNQPTLQTVCHSYESKTSLTTLVSLWLFHFLSMSSTISLNSQIFILNHNLTTNNNYNTAPIAWSAAWNPSSSSSLVVAQSFSVTCRLVCVPPLLEHSTSKMNVANMIGRTASPRFSSPRCKSSAFSLTTASSAGPRGSLLSKLTRSDSWFESFTCNSRYWCKT